MQIEAEGVLGEESVEKRKRVEKLDSVQNEGSVEKLLSVECRHFEVRQSVESEEQCRE